MFNPKIIAYFQRYFSYTRPLPNITQNAMKKLLIIFFLIFIISCADKKVEIKKQSEREIVIDSINQLKNLYKKLDKIYKENKSSRDSIRPLLWEICPKYFNLLNKLSKINQPVSDSIILSLTSTGNKLNQNQLFLNSLLKKSIDTTIITIEKPISPIFHSLEKKLGIYNSSENKSGDDDLLEKTDYYKRIIKAESVSSMMGKLTSYKKVIDSLYKNGKYLNLYSTSKKHKAIVTKFGFRDDECTPYYFYESQLLDNSFNNEYFLFASNYDIEITYENNTEIDKLINNQYPNICADCPSSYNFQKTFAKLNGFKNLYFTYAIELNSEIDKTDTPLRTLVYVKGETIIYLWSSDIDMFGCSCL